MPEQPDDPLHYDMKIPPEPDPKEAAWTKAAALGPDAGREPE